MFFPVAAVLLLTPVLVEPILIPSHPRFRRMYGGEKASIEKHPYQVSLLDKDNDHWCGGSIISAHYVLTAAHCVDDAPEELYHTVNVRAGSALRHLGGSVHQVEKVFVHEKYQINEDDVPVDDIALLRVKQPFHFDETRQPIELYGANDEAVPGVKAVITGWGAVEGTSKLPYRLQKATAFIVDKRFCHKIYFDQAENGLPDGQICAGNGHYSLICDGDSGGPLVIGGRQAGIVSWSAECTEPYVPGVYTEVAAYRDWIDQRVQF